MANINRGDRSNLGYIGPDFQYKLIACFLREPNFFKDMYTIVDQNMFTESQLRMIVGVMKDSYVKRGTVLDPATLKIMLRSRAMDADEGQQFDEIVDEIMGQSYAGHEEIEEVAEKFFKQQNWIKIAHHIIDNLSDGDLGRYDELEKMIDEAHSVGRHEHNTYRPFDDLEETLSEQSVTVIPTGINGLDEVLGGGLEKGKIGLIICPMGMGKTSMTTCIAANAATTRCDANLNKGFKVLQICFEDKARDLRRKYVAKATQVEARKLKPVTDDGIDIVALLNNPNLKEVKELCNENIQILKLATGTYSASLIKEEIRKKINEGFYPDLVIIDYFECIEAESGTGREDVTTREGKTMRKFETMADELNIAIWLPTQGNRESITSDLPTNDKVGGSIRKNQIAHVVIGIARPNPSDMEQNKACIAVLKNRSGLAGKVFNNILFNNGTCTIDTEGKSTDFETQMEYKDDDEDKITSNKSFYNTRFNSNSRRAVDN